MIQSPFLVPFDNGFSIAATSSQPPKGTESEKKLRKQLRTANKKLYDLQRVLYAHNRHALLVVFQAMDAAGKDSTIRTVMRGVNPAGCQVFSFKQPSAEELDHDFLWRSAQRLPERGRIGIFNRSYYEETLVVKAHPEYLLQQQLPDRPGTSLDELWQERFESIRSHEQHLANNGTTIVKFWLNVSKEEQKARFLERLNNPEKNWKFSSSDLAERAHWDKYMAAYEETLNATSRPAAPWYAIPADSKDYMRLTVANILIETLESLALSYPKLEDSKLAKLTEYRQQLEAE